MKSIDLAIDYGGPMETSPAEPTKTKHYPTFTYDGPNELGLPESGTMTIRFREVRREESRANGKERYSCTVEVQEIVSVKSGPQAPAKSDKSTEQALDGLMKKRMKEKDAEDY